MDVRINEIFADNYEFMQHDGGELILSSIENNTVNIELKKAYENKSVTDFAVLELIEMQIHTIFKEVEEVNYYTK